MLEKPEEIFAELGETLSASAISMTEDSILSQAHGQAGNIAKAKEIAQCGMYTHLMALSATTLSYVMFTENEFEIAETALNRLMKLIRIYNFEKINANEAGKAYIIGANLYCVHCHIEKALDLLEKYADLCVDLYLPFKYKSDSFFTDIQEWLDNNELGSSFVYDAKMIKQNILKSFNAFPSFSVLHDEPRYKAALQKLTDFVNSD
jgi:hypothetical protein